MHGRSGHLGRIATAITLAIVVALIAVAIVRVLSADEAGRADRRPSRIASPIASTTPAGEATPEPAAEEPESRAAFPMRGAIIDLRSGTVRRVPNAIGTRVGFGTDYRVSPNGRQIAFVAIDADGVRRIHVASLQGRHIRVVSDGSQHAQTPAWSPDGDRIVFEGSQEDLFVVEVASGRTTRIWRGVGEVWTPGFSPDGRTVLFTRSSRSGRALSLWTVSATGGQAIELVRHAAYGAYSPDGTTIAFHPVRHAVVPGTTWPFDFGVALVDADGSGRRRLLRSTGWTMAPIDWDWTRPAWSPDGARIAFQFLSMQSEGDIRVVDTTTGRFVVVGRGALPTWVDDHTLLVERFTPVGGDLR
jgi:Tol biopolymer transport system component